MTIVPFLFLRAQCVKRAQHVTNRIICLTKDLFMSWKEIKRRQRHENRLYMNVQMVGTIAIPKARTFENRTILNLIFKKSRFHMVKFQIPTKSHLWFETFLYSGKPEEWFDDFFSWTDQQLLQVRCRMEVWSSSNSHSSMEPIPLQLSRTRKSLIHFNNSSNSWSSCKSRY